MEGYYDSLQILPCLEDRLLLVALLIVDIYTLEMNISLRKYGSASFYACLTRSSRQPSSVLVILWLLDYNLLLILIKPFEGGFEVSLVILYHVPTSLT